MASSCSLDSLNKAAKGAARKAFKVALSVLLVVGFLPVVEQEAFAEETSASEGRKVKAIHFRDDFSSAVLEDGSLYMWGDNNSKFLPTEGYRYSVHSPEKVLDGVRSYTSSNTGYQHAAIDESGSLYVWGSYYDEWESKNKYWGTTPTKMLDNVQSVSLGRDHILALQSPVSYMAGQVYAWGSGFQGQLGNDSTANSSEPQLVSGVGSAIKIAAGYSHSTAVALDGSLYVWGYHGYGKTSGLNPTTNYRVPAKALDDVVSTAAGLNYSGAITADGSLYMWGCNDDGIVGIGSTSEQVMSPTKILENVKSVTLGNSSAAAITTDGSLYMWGWNGYGQIGVGSLEETYVLSPVKVLDNVESVTLGTYATAAITTDGSLYMWGGSEDIIDEAVDGPLAPTKIFENVSSVSLADHHYGLVTEDGSLYTWGRDYMGALGNGEGQSDYVATPTKITFPGDEETEEPSEPDAPTSSETIETEALIRAEETGAGSVAYPVVWDDDWFKAQDNGSYEYNSKLAVSACALAASAYNNTSTNGHRHVKTTLRQLGFESIDVSSYIGRVKNEGYGGEFDRVAYAFATKQIPDGEGGWDTLVAVVVRGTPGNVEWVSNANVNDSAYEGYEDEFGDSAHEGFYHASAELEGRLDAYLAEQGVAKSDVKFLVTGHSRGAAVANIVASNLNDDKAVDMRNVYAYCYATPRVSSSKVAGHHSAEYDNIINVVNPEDFVPRVPLAKWGYERYGRTFYLPCRSTQKSLWKDGVKEVKSGYEEYFGQGYASFKGSHRTDKLVKDVYSLAKDVDQAYTKKNAYFLDWSDSSDGQTCGATFIEYFRVLMNKLAYPGEDYYLWKLLEYSNAGDYTPVTAYFLVNYAIPDMAKLDDKVFGAHSEKTYLLWTSYLADAAITPIEAGEKCDTGKMTMYCPVDVTVYDPDGNVVASIVDDVLDEELAESDEGLAAYVDPDTGAKSVWVPLGQGYRVETVATDSGTLDVTWSVSDPEGETVQQEARVDLPLEEGTTYVAEVSDQGDSGAFEDSVSFVDGDGEEIEPDFTADAESAGSLEISVSAAEGGTASGNAQATAGDHVTVSATPEVGHLFGGWYEGGSLVSPEATWTFRAEASRSLEARFVACEHLGGYPCDVCGYAEFTIEDCDIAVEPDPFVYAGGAKPEVTVTYEGVELVEGEDYTLTFGVGGGSFGGAYKGTHHACVAPITGHIANRWGWVLKDHPTEEEFNCGYTVVDAPLTAAMISFPQASYVYSGKVQKPKPKVTVADTAQLASSYEVAYLNRTKKYKVSPKLVGTYWVRVKSRPAANTSSTAWKKLVISPKATYVTGRTRLNNGFRVSWKKRTVQCSGYQVRYSLRSDFKTYGTKTLKGYGYSSKKVTGLKDKRTYYVKVRTYKTVNGVRYYSAWSPVKTVMTK